MITKSCWARKLYWVKCRGAPYPSPIKPKAVESNSLRSNVEVLPTPPPSSLQLLSSLRFTLQTVVLNMFNGVIV